MGGALMGGALMRAPRMRVVRRAGPWGRVGWEGLVLCGLLQAGSGWLPAQPAPTADLIQRASRLELTARARDLEGQLASPKLGDSRRRSTERELAALRQRLMQGDFRVGDRFTIVVRHDTVRVDTASVRDSLKVTILNLPDLSLAGVLRAELDERIGTHVARYLRNATVRTNPLTRIAVLGAVRVPGYYYVSPDRPLSDLLMVAGGPAPEADVDHLEVFRGPMRLIAGKESKRLVRDGRTLEQLDIQSGDEVRIPVKRKVNWGVIVQLFFVATSLFFGFLQFLQWYYNRQAF